MNYENLSFEEHRAQTLGELLKLLQEKDKVICPRYPGYGKTSYIAKRLIELNHDKRFLVLVPSKAIEESYLKFNMRNFITATYQSLLYKTEDSLIAIYKDIDFIICDECHHLDDNIWLEKVDTLYNSIKNIKIIGLTGTPIRGDGHDVIDKYFEGNTVTEFDMFDAIKSGYLPKIKYVRAFYDFSKKMSEKYVQEMIPNNVLNIKEILYKYIDSERLASNFKILVYVSRLCEIQDTADKCLDWFGSIFPFKNINIYYQTSSENKQFNLNMLNSFENNTNEKDIDIMISVDKIKEGVHIDGVNTEILLRRTKSPCVYIQQLGRCINKGSQPLIFDLIDNYSSIEYKKPVQKQESIKINSRGKRIYRTFEDILDCIELEDEIKNILDIAYKYSRIKKRTTQITDEMRNTALDLYNKGKTRDFIAKTLSISSTFTQHILDDLGLNPVDDKKRQRQQLEIEVSNLYKEGYTQQQIADMYGKYTSNIAYILKKQGLTGTYRRDLDTRNKQICELYEKGVSVEQIASEFNRSVSAIGDVIRKNVRLPNVDRVKKEREELEKKICNLRLAGNTYKQVATKLNITQSVVQKTLKKNNLMGIKITPHNITSRNENIYKLFKDGLTISQVAREVGVSHQQVTSIIEKHEQTRKILETRRKHRKDSIANLNLKVVDLYRKGFTTAQIMKKLKISKNYTLGILKNNNIPIRINGRTKEDNLKLAKKGYLLRERGWTYIKIAEALGVGECTAARLVKQYSKGVVKL